MQQAPVEQHESASFMIAVASECGAGVKAQLLTELTSVHHPRWQ